MQIMLCITLQEYMNTHTQTCLWHWKQYRKNEKACEVTVNRQKTSPTGNIIFQMNSTGAVEIAQR